ncbi:MAG: dihydropteroate synthase [Myxococcota bacterium]
MNARTIFPPHRVTIVGALNVTPDSFSDGGRFVSEGERVNVDAAVEAAASLVGGGAHVIDVGGESTRPGALAVAVRCEIERTRDVVAAIAKHIDVPISIDTRKAEVAEAALEAGAHIVNDVSGLAFDPRLAEVAARSDAVLVLGHARGTPEAMQRDPHYDDVVREVGDALVASVGRAREAGVPEEQLAVDPGLGFGKRLEDNLALLGRLGELRDRLGLPLWVGPSRKSFLGAVTGEPVGRRDEATFAACAVAAFAGADALRVHEAAGAARAAAVGRAARDARSGAGT